MSAAKKPSNSVRELDKSFSEQKKFSSEDQKKLDRLEKLVKKIRSELGGDDDDTFEKDDLLLYPLPSKSCGKPHLIWLISIKKSTRYSVSVAAIESSNALLKIVRFIRFSK